MFFLNLFLPLVMTLTVSSNSLFGDDALIPPDVTYPSYAVEELETVSGNDPGTQLLVDSVSSLEEQISALSESNEALSSELQAIASGTGNAAEAYLSATLIDVMERVVNGKPFCKYVAYRTSYDDTNAGTLVYGTRCHTTGTQITVENGYLVEYYRYRYNTSSQWQYRYTVTPVDSYTVRYGANTLLYTNCLSGYPTLGFNYYLLLIGALAIAVLIYAFKRGD